MSKRVLVVDGLNLFIRSWVCNPSLNSNGAPFGGVDGSMKSLQKQLREVKPDEVIVCWDGTGGTARRRLISEDYKAGRKIPKRLNRSFEITDEQELANKDEQLSRLIEYFGEMPLTQLYLPTQEADDLISWVVNHEHFAGWQKVILSNDKDFYQLCDDETVIVRPITKQVVSKRTILENDGIHPKNYALARAMAGDPSDNLPGLNRVGLATAIKRFPFLKEDKSFQVADLVAYSEQNLGKVKIYQDLLDNQESIVNNYKIMQLYNPEITPEESFILHRAIEENKELNKTKIRVMLMQDGIGSLNLDYLLSHFQNV
jgi:5'-3' exonuclease